MTARDARYEEIRAWLSGTLHWRHDFRLEPASADASFRRYFRAWRPDGSTRIVMDAPPGHEDTAPYLKATRLLAACGVHVPVVEAAETSQGFLLLEDLGQAPLLGCLQAGGDADALYGDALAALAQVQLRGAAGAAELARYDAPVLEREMRLLPDWYLARHLGLAPSDEDREVFAATEDFLVREALVQPVVLVHRDYHSRNLMVTAERSPGIIDMQDAIAGPVAYDLASLLKDCYIAWPRARVLGWLRGHRARLAAEGGPVGAGEDEFLRWFELIGLQRHIKVLGIFARLCHRDGKQGYLADLPLVLRYVLEAAARFPELASFHAWAKRRLEPGLKAANARARAAA
jgi:aminoglycoside/choline kinase family phosphotransferase